MHILKKNTCAGLNVIKNNAVKSALWKLPKQKVHHKWLSDSSSSLLFNRLFKDALQLIIRTKLPAFCTFSIYSLISTSPGSRWLCCSACWELWKVLILSPQSDPSRRTLLPWRRGEQTSPSGCSKTPWSYWTTWWAERWCSAWTEEETGKKVSDLMNCAGDWSHCWECFIYCVYFVLVWERRC